MVIFAKSGGKRQFHAEEMQVTMWADVESSDASRRLIQ
jgi:hypothetical protein